MCKAILRTLEKVLGDLWTPETARAWTEMWESAMEAMSKVGWEALHPIFLFRLFVLWTMCSLRC
jgi:hypothetical protein